MTTGWCTGGTFASGAADGMFNIPDEMVGDTTNGILYISDTNNNRIVKINANTGVFVGAIGKTTASSGTCSVGATTGWCTGGTFALAGTDGAFNRPKPMAIDVTNQLLYIGEWSGSRINKVR